MAKKEKKPFKQRCKDLAGEFKKFIMRGNVVDMAVGVVIGGAFSTIIKSLTNILLELATWGIPGGLTGLVTVLPAINDSQKPAAGLLESYTVGSEAWEALTAAQKAGYTQFGDVYYYNQLAIINWGAFINAIISFLIIGLTLFIIVKTVQFLGKKHQEFENKLKEEYYKKHPEERPEPDKPAPKPITELDVLQDMNKLMHQQAYNVRPRTGVSSHHK